MPGLGAMANAPACRTDPPRLLAESIWKKQIPIYCFYDHFLDSDDQLVHEELPSADFSRGGVCLLGASSMNWGSSSGTCPIRRDA